MCTPCKNQNVTNTWENHLAKKTELNYLYHKETGEHKIENKLRTDNMRWNFNYRLMGLGPTM